MWYGTHQRYHIIYIHDERLFLKFEFTRKKKPILVHTIRRELVYWTSSCEKRDEKTHWGGGGGVSVEREYMLALCM